PPGNLISVPFMLVRLAWGCDSGDTKGWSRLWPVSVTRTGRIAGRGAGDGGAQRPGHTLRHAPLGMVEPVRLHYTVGRPDGCWPSSRRPGTAPQSPSTPLTATVTTPTAGNPAASRPPGG